MLFLNTAQTLNIDIGSHGTRLRRPCGLAVGGEGRHAYLVDMARC